MGENSAGAGERRRVAWVQRFRSLQSAAVAGIIAAVGWIVALTYLIIDLPPLDASDAEIVAHYVEVDGVLSVLVHLQLLTFATIGFLWFVGVIRHRIGAAEPKLFGTVFFGSGIMLAVLLFVGIAVGAAPAVLVGEADRMVDPDVAATTRTIARIILGVVTPRIASLFILSMSTLALRTGALPKWLIVASYLTGIANLVNVTFASPNVYVFPVWMTVVSVYLLVAAPHMADVASPLPDDRAHT